MDRLEIALQIYIKHNPESLLLCTDERIKQCFAMADKFILFDDENPAEFVKVGNRKRFEEHIVNRICKYFNIKKSNLNSDYKGQETVLCRNYIWFWLKFFFTKLDYWYLAGYGARTHATVIHGIIKTKQMINTKDKAYKDAYDFFVLEFKPDLDRLKVYMDRENKAGYKK